MVPCKVSRGQETWVQKLKSPLLVVRMTARAMYAVLFFKTVIGLRQIYFFVLYTWCFTSSQLLQFLYNNNNNGDDDDDDDDNNVNCNH